jgi:glycosyltransferase involved in cell wall biosynthesis
VAIDGQPGGIIDAVFPLNGGATQVTAPILHVTEAMVAGVAHLISHLARSQAKDNHKVVVAHSIRPNSPSPEELERLFPAPIVRRVVPMTTEPSPIQDGRGVIALIRLFREINPRVIHLHSSKAGALGRLAARILGLQHRVYYSPHGLAFLREDVSPFKRECYRYFEKIGSGLGGTIVASSASERELVRSRIRGSEVTLVENGVDLLNITASNGSGISKVRVVTSGRISFPKAPWRFRDVAAALTSEDADFVWIGDGDMRDQLLVGGSLPANVSITGWSIDGSQVFVELARSDIFLAASLWEGMPMSLIEAQTAGLPAVVSDVVGCRDVVIDGETGFVCRSNAALVERTRLLIRDSQLRKKMGQRARDVAIVRFSVERMHREMLEVYGGR